jgi:hypothetical protein
MIYLALFSAWGWRDKRFCRHILALFDCLGRYIRGYWSVGFAARGISYVSHMSVCRLVGVSWCQTGWAGALRSHHTVWPCDAM